MADDSYLKLVLKDQVAEAGPQRSGIRGWYSKIRSLRLVLKDHVAEAVPQGSGS